METLEVPPRPMPALERNIQFLALTPHKDLGFGIDWRGILRGPLLLACRLVFPEAARVGPRGPHRNSRSACHNSRKSRRFPNPGELRPMSAEASRG